jgi:hypothetical protein
MIRVVKRRSTAVPPITAPAMPPRDRVAGEGARVEIVGEVVGDVEVAVVDEEDVDVDVIERGGDVVEDEDIPVLDTTLETPLG